jgi:hypothetical protein
VACSQTDSIVLNAFQALCSDYSEISYIPGNITIMILQFTDVVLRCFTVSFTVKKLATRLPAKTSK